MQVIPDNIDFSKYLENREGDCVKPAHEWRSAVHERFANRGAASGWLLPWASSHERVQLRPGEVSIFAGINGHGKSMVTGQIMLWAMRQGARYVVASMEMPPASTLQRMIRQASGSGAPTQRYVDGWLDWTDQRMWIYDQQDSVASDRILGLLAYGAEVIKADIVVIDSLMKCGIAPDDYAKQKAFIDRVCWLAKDTGLHIAVVAHMRKGEREGKRPDKFDLKGAGELSDMVDNVFIVHRNKDKEESIQAGKVVEEHIPDATLNVAKQRHGEWEGLINLWFHKASEQFINRPDARVMDWGIDVINFQQGAA